MASSFSGFQVTDFEAWPALRGRGEGGCSGTPRVATFARCEALRSSGSEGAVDPESSTNQFWNRSRGTGPYIGVISPLKSHVGPCQGAIQNSSEWLSSQAIGQNNTRSS